MMLTDFFFFCRMNEPRLSFIFFWTQWLAQKSHVPKLFIGYFASPFKQASGWVMFFTLQLPNRKFIHSYGYLPIASVRLLLVSVMLKASRLCCVNTSSLEQQKNIPSCLLVTLKPDGLCPFAAPVATTTVLLIALISPGVHLMQLQHKHAAEEKINWFVWPWCQMFLLPTETVNLVFLKKITWKKQKQKHNLHG